MSKFPMDFKLSDFVINSKLNFAQCLLSILQSIAYALKTTNIIGIDLILNTNSYA